MGHPESMPHIGWWAVRQIAEGEVFNYAKQLG